MADTTKIILEQELESLGPVLLTRLKAAKDSLEEGDLEALHLMVGNLGTCSFQVKQNDDDIEWKSSVPFGSGEKQSSLLFTLLALLWQHGKLQKVSHDPIGFLVGSKQKMEEEEQDSKLENCIFLENNGENSADDEEALTEDGINYLIGPYEIDLDREDYYHGLFETYRKSYERRAQNFLDSKHLPKARKLSVKSSIFYDLTFIKEVLVKAAASVEEIDFTLYGAKELEIFRNVHMPKLRRLRLWVERGDGENDYSPHVFPPPRSDDTGLRYLHANLPRPTLESLLHNNATTLLELNLPVGTAHSNFDRWPYSCSDLHELLSCCNGTLRRLVLMRKLYAHTRASCLEQVNAVRQSLPGLKVICEYCSS